MCIERKTSPLSPSLKNKHFSCQEGLTLNGPAVHIRSIGLLRWPWLFGEECSWEGKFLMCELREGMWCDCASFLLITCSQSAVWAAWRNYRSEGSSLCVLKIVLCSCEPEAYSLDWKHLPCMYVYVCFGWREGCLMVDILGMNLFCMMNTYFHMVRQKLPWDKCSFHLIPFCLIYSVISSPSKWCVPCNYILGSFSFRIIWNS